jgi:hypothetical protein
MDADYSIELGPTAPALEIPWEDPEGRVHYIKLRQKQGSAGRVFAGIEILRIPEARQFPALGRFLVEVNSPPSPWETAKCEVWMTEADAAENLYNLGFEQSCYVDMVLAEETEKLRPSLEVHQRLARELAGLLETQEAMAATADIVIRRCYFHLSGKVDESDAGYCLTLFLSAFGSSPPGAAACWERAMQFAAECLQRLQPHDDRAKAQELS